MVTKWDRIIFSVIALVVVGGFVFWKDVKGVLNKSEGVALEKVEKKGKKDKEGDKESSEAATADYPAVNIAGKWEMPQELVEISGIAWLDKDRFACVQDELGTIFIYSLASKSVVKEIPFGNAGDYEGIAVTGSTAYVVRADGKLFEVSGFESGKPAVKQYATHLTVKQDVEGLCYDAMGKRLLLSIKGAEPHTKAYKGIYGFDLSTKTMDKEPVYKIDLAQAALSGGGKKSRFEPSDLDIHPTSGELYITDASGGKLAVMKTNGEIRQVYGLDKREFTQPEGISFNADGELFISNEGGKGRGNILKVVLP
ncbi:MAG: hypothetical protein JWP69_246 [Flaviaesturariibacter sp.]|nr:hypothetical protein [Flaviaesturariibacter sp.]